MGQKFRRVVIELGDGASKASFAFWKCLVLSSPEDTSARGPCFVTVI